MPLDGVIAMTNAEKQVVLNLNPENTTKFTIFNLETYIRLRIKEAYPRIFGSQSPDWLTSLDAQLVNISDIDLDNKYYEQLARVNVNPKQSDMKEDFITNGFSLAELGIMLAKLKNGKYVVLEGRTRLKILRELGMTNIIADIFKVKNDKLSYMVKFGIFMNATKKPYGEASFFDIQKGIMFLIETGDITKQENTVKGRSILRDMIAYELDYISGGKLTPNEYDTIIYEAIDKATGVKNVISFPNGKGSQEYLENLIGEEKLKEDLQNGIKYVAVAAFDEKVYGRFIRELGKVDKTVTEIRFVMQIGVPNARDPEGTWIKDAAGFKKRFTSFENKISDIRFNGVRIDDSRIKIYGAIPQVRSLADKYPMDRIYVYK